MAVRDLSKFNNTYDRGRSALVRVIWHIVSTLIVRNALTPNAVRIAVLRLFGAQIGSGVVIRGNVKILWPWHLSVGESSWVGEDAHIVNLVPVIVGANACVSQGAMLCTGSHDFRKADFAYNNAPIQLCDGSWVGARAVVLPGVVIGRHSVVAAGEVVRDSLPELTLLVRGVSRPIGQPE